MSNTYRITVTTVEELVITADTVEEAEVRAFESDAWQTMNVNKEVMVLSTTDPKLIREAFEQDEG